MQAPAGRSEGRATWVRLHCGGAGACPSHGRFSAAEGEAVSCRSLATGLTPAACLRSSIVIEQLSQTASGSPLMAMTFS